MNEFEQLYVTYKNLVFNLSLQYVQNKQDAEEITQDVFVKIHQTLHTFKHEAKIQTWIYRITVNKCLDFLKAKQSKKRFALFTSIFTSSISTELADNADNIFAHPGVDLEQKESLKIIFDCLNQLPDKQKTALILHKIEHIPQLEIAEIMQLHPKAVESLIQRAKANLQKKLDRYEGNKP